MKLLILGCNGQLGRDLMQQAERLGLKVTGADLPQCDITDPASLQHTLDGAGEPDVIINAAAYTAVDRAEGDPDAAFAVNRDGPGHIARICRERQIILIHLSTDYVFDGSQRRPYSPSDSIRPMGVYGRSKAEGETAVRNQCERHVIVRTSWLFGVRGPNFVKTMLRLGKERDELRVVDDQIGSPTYAGDLAAALLSIATQLVQKETGWGTYHFCNQGTASWHGFTQRIFDIAGAFAHLRVRHIVPISSAQYPAAAPRPAYSVLDCSSLEKQFAITRRAYDAALADMIRELYRTGSVV